MDLSKALTADPVTALFINRSANRSATALEYQKAFQQNAGRLEFTGAGEEIRTLDPRLGKINYVIQSMSHCPPSPIL